MADAAVEAGPAPDTGGADGGGAPITIDGEASPGGFSASSLRFAVVCFSVRVWVVVGVVVVEYSGPRPSCYSVLRNTKS